MGRSDSAGVGPVVTRRQVSDRDIPAPAKASLFQQFSVQRRVKQWGIFFNQVPVLRVRDLICMSTSFTYVY